MQQSLAQNPHQRLRHGSSHKHVAVWQKIWPLVGEARRLEHATLFADFERLLPACRVCYVPVLDAGSAPNLSVSNHVPPPLPQIPRISIAALARRLNAGERVTLLDARSAAQRAKEPRTLPTAIAMPAEEVAARYRELPTDGEIVVYCA